MICAYYVFQQERSPHLSCHHNKCLHKHFILFISQEGIFDMDYQMRMVDRGGAGISNLEYKTWRSTGNAYNFGDSEDDMEENYCMPNNSLVSSLVTHKGGDRLSRRGYWGDIITGPFMVYGLEQKDEVKSRHFQSTVFELLMDY